MKETESKPCPFCSGKKTEYQNTHNTKLFLHTFGKKSVLITESTCCPPHSDCSMKDIPARSAFVIKFCPECGRDLRKPKVIYIVRCRECRYHFDGECLNPKNRAKKAIPELGEHYEIAFSPKVEDEHFCSYGERKEKWAKEN